MKMIIIPEDGYEVKRLTKALDMANLLFEIYHNLADEFKMTGDEEEECEHGEVFHRIYELFDAHDIVNIDELVIVGEGTID